MILHTPLINIQLLDVLHVYWLKPIACAASLTAGCAQ